MVVFFLGKDIIVPAENNLKYTKLDDAGRLYLDMTKVKDKNYMDILMKADTVIIENKECKVLERCFHIDGTTLFITLEEIEKSK